MVVLISVREGQIKRDSDAESQEWLCTEPS